MNFEYITAESREKIGIITLNNPQTLNSVNDKMLHELAIQINEFNKNKDIRVIVLKGIEKSFAAGMDIKTLAADIQNTKTILKNMQNDFKEIATSVKPMIAAVSGFALGIGCELAFCCDIILATDTSRFGLPELSIGLLPCFGGCGAVAKRIGKAKTMDMILTGKAFSADEAEKAGLISRVVTPESLTEEYIKIARRIAALPQTVTETAKKIISSAEINDCADLETLLSLEAVKSDDFRKILMSFAANTSANAEKS